MAILVPETATRLQAEAFVTNAELAAVGRSEIIRYAAKSMAERALHKLLDDCIRTENYQGFSGQTLRLDVYILSPSDLRKMLVDAQRQGEQDALRWGNYSAAARGEG